MDDPRTPSPEPRPGSLLGLGLAWTRIGYVLLALAVVALVLNLAVHPAFVLRPGAKIPEGYRLVAGKDFAKEGGLVVGTSTLALASIPLVVFSALSTFVWTFVDVFDRRKRFVWLLPAFICPLVGTLHALPLALYLFFGRETVGHGEGVS